MSTRGLLYPALHKFYSALKSLEEFEKGKDFFDNISYLDNFFSEYRNITFVLQKSLAHSSFMTIYEQFRDEFLVNNVGKWFIDKRNEVLKQQPFDLEKKILIRIYSTTASASLPELTFTIDNDVPISTIINSLKRTFSDLLLLEIMFSVEYSFYERGDNKDLYDNFISGINQMKLFMAAMKNALNEQCPLCDQLDKKIAGLNFYRVPKNMLFIDDYVFYTKKSKFEKAHRVEMWVGNNNVRVPIKNLDIYKGKDLFENFETMHLVMFRMQKTLLPTCLVAYSDDTFQFLTFGTSIKTTVYRKMDEIARCIEKDSIVRILYVTEMYSYNSSDVLKMDSNERIPHAQKEVLSFFSIDKDLRTITHSYDAHRIDDFSYIASVVIAEQSESILPGFMTPIFHEFSRLQEENKRS